MQADPADFMSAAQMSKDRRECKVVLRGKHGVSACICSQSGITELQNKRKRRHSSEMQNTAAGRLQVVQHVAPHQADREKRVDGH